MRLEDNYMSGVGTSGLNRAQATDGIDRKSGKGSSGAAPAGGSDEVSLSTLTERLRGLSAELEATGEGSAAREAKLNSLTEVVASGKYSPDADELSTTLIDSMLADKP